MGLLMDRCVGRFLILIARLLTGAYANWVGCEPLKKVAGPSQDFVGPHGGRLTRDARSRGFAKSQQRLYFANHASHLDFLLLWAMLPPALRYQTRPVAGADYWNASPLRRYLIHRVFRGVLVERGGGADHGNPLAPLQAALDAGDSLIFFPEGTRALGDEMLPFKSGLYHLARANPQLALIPVRLENLNRVMPKGELLPVPLVCILNFGAPMALGADEPKDLFLVRARQAILDMKVPQ